jgi:O-antigen/teichoic acid export membrane protein
LADESTIQSIVMGSFWLFLGVAIFNIVGFLYWMMASLFVSPGVVGSVSAILSFESLMINVCSLGVPIGMRRFIGFSWGQHEPEKIPQYLSTSLAFTAIINIPAFSLILAIAFLNIPFLNLGSFEMFSIAILMALDFWPSIYASLFIAILKTRVTTVSNSMSSIVKVVVGVFLLEMGFGFIGIIISMISASLTREIILLSSTRKLSNEFGFSLYRGVSIQSMSEILKAGIASWIPNTLMILGQAIGVLLIYGYVGGEQTGLYYIAFALSAVAYNLPNSIQSLMFPVLSGMDAGKEETIRNAIRLSLAAVAPIALAMVVYSQVPFLLLPSSYANAANPFSILMIGLLVIPAVGGYSSYVYALGKYMHVTLIDTVSTVVRLFSYFVLIIPFGALGAAIAYVLGIVSSILPAIISARYIGFSFEAKQYSKTLVTPFFSAIAVYFVNLPWALGIIFLLITSYIVYARSGVITKSDVRQMALAFLSPESVERVHTHTKRIVTTLFGD